MSVLTAFGFNDFSFNLSTRNIEKSVGSDEIWDTATEALVEALEREGLSYQIKEGDAAFYGPKIDIDVCDAIGRSWQLSTIQLDFNLPDRFNLRYIDSAGERKRPVMIHRALMGSIERFFGVLIEHYAGAFPVWLAPLQVSILPVAEEHETYAEQVEKVLRTEGFRVDVERATNSLGKRIRDVKSQKIPYVLVVGGEDIESQTVGVNPRGGEVERGVPLDDFIQALSDEAKSQI
jgi:threonyl-tRNA synthetase